MGSAGPLVDEMPPHCSTCDPRVPQPPPVRLSLPANTSSPGATIQNGRLVRRRRRRFFRLELHRASELLQRPGLATSREVGAAAWALYAAYCFYFRAAAAWDLAVASPVETVCRGRSFVGCGWDMLYMAVCVQLWSWLGKVVPWGIVCAVVIFLWEEVLRRRT